MRIILHMDLDSFYASVEEKRRPEIAGKPVVICVYSGRTADSGAVATANYIARERGIKAGISIVQAKKMADADTVFLPYDKPFYEEVSDRIMDLIEDECDILEKAGIDEAYMDVTKKAGSWERAGEIARKVKEIIREHEGLTCSIGIGPNKLIAKMAGKVKKPDGLTAVREKEVKEFIESFDVKKIHGIGAKTSEILNGMGIRTAKELAAFDYPELEIKLGKNKALLLRNKAMGKDESPVVPRVMKQISRLGTLKEDTDDRDKIMEKISSLAESLGKRLEKKGATFRTVSVIFIDTAMRMRTRSETIEQTGDMKKAVKTAEQLVEKFMAKEKVKIRRIGISISNLEYAKRQKSLSEFKK